jgi:hypothetical protein
MSRFNAEFSRLYLAPEQGRLLAKDGNVKAMVLELARPADWTALSTLWHGAQHDLELPAAAIAVSEPVSATHAADFLTALQSKYLSAIPAKRIGVYPSPASVATGNAVHARAVPAVQEGTANWSAFVSPDLASVFGEEPWLDIPPNQDQQADILSRIKSMTLSQFHDVLSLLGAARNQVAPLAESAARERPENSAAPSRQGPGTMGPREFLTMVMNDPAAGLHDRIEAAKALLPYTR